MDRLTVGFWVTLATVMATGTKLACKFTAWYMQYRQSKRDARLYGRNTIMDRMLAHTPPSAPDPTQRDKAV